MCDLTRDRPKCLVELEGHSLLDLQMSALTQAGIQEVGLVRGYLGEMLEGRHLHLFDNPHWETTNMVSSLLCAARWLRAEPCIVSYSDIFYSARTVRALAHAQGAIAIAYDPDWLALWSRRFRDPLQDAESFRQEGGLLLDIGRKVADLSEIQGQYTGLLRFTPEGFAKVEAHLTLEEAGRLDMTTLLRQLLALGTSIAVTEVLGSWGEVDNGNDLALYTRLIQEGSLPFPP